MQKYDPKKFNTEFEKILWEMLYRSQVALAEACLAEANREREEPGDWPAGQEWKDLSGSSQAVFAQRARDKAGINHDSYLKILRGNEDAGLIASQVLDERMSR